MKRSILPTLLLFCVAAYANAASLTMSIGVRETEAGGGASGGPIFSNGHSAGALGGIEWVNLDSQTLTADGTWQLFSFTPSVDPITGFAGSTADGTLDGEWGTLEHIRILNSDGITNPIRLWVDDVNNTDSAASVTEGFEGASVGDEVMFQEPSFSGSTAGNLVAGSTAGVSSSMALTGQQSYEANFQFVDNTPTRWLRFTSFNTANVPNAAVHFNESAFAPTISFWAKAVVIPEPSSFALLALGLVGVIASGRRRAA